MRVRGSQKEVPKIEVNVDTVYIRTNVQEVNEDGLKSWEYDEEQIPKDEFIKKIQLEKDEQVLELKQEQVVLNRLTADNSTAQQELLELLIEMGVI